MTILDKIILNKRNEVGERKSAASISSFIDEIERTDREFLKAIRKKDKINLIAEIKKSAPSAGKLRSEEEVLDIVKIYNKYASAISVVTDKKFFDGDLNLLGSVRNSTNLPILCKDFIIDEYQIYEARSYGADAVLLICSILDADEIDRFIAIAKDLGMDCMLEVSNEAEMKIAVGSKAQIIGINNRNLDDFSIDLSKTGSLTSLVKERRVLVSESGILSNENLQDVEGNVDCVLIGTAFMQADDIEKKIIEIFNI